MESKQNWCEDGNSTGRFGKECRVAMYIGVKNSLISMSEG